MKYSHSPSLIATDKNKIEIIDINKSGKKGPLNNANGTRHKRNDEKLTIELLKFNFSNTVYLFIVGILTSKNLFNISGKSSLFSLSTASFNCFMRSLKTFFSRSGSCTIIIELFSVL